MMAREPGTIITFYSYKGGVGRSFALSNVGALLSMWGYRVLCIDWDLEAPGLNHYFASQIEHPQRSGVVQFFDAFRRGQRPRWKDYVTRVRMQGRGFDLMMAGVNRARYAQTLEGIDWDHLYAKKRLGGFLEKLRDDWKAAYDFVLVDSRTGLSDSSGICSIQLPDILVAVSAPNMQSLRGVVNVVDGCREARNHLPFNRPRLMVLPIASRVESRVEWEISRKWLEHFARSFGHYYADWIHRTVFPEQLVQQTKLAHIPYWSYGEGLPVLKEGTKDPESIGHTFETIASLLAQRLQGSELLVRNRELYVAQAQNSKRTRRRAQRRYPYDMYLAYAPSDEAAARAISAALQKRGMRVLDPTTRGVRYSKQFKDSSIGVQHAKHLLVVVSERSEDLRPWEIAQFLIDTTSDTEQLRVVVPVLLPNTTGRDVPTFLRQFQPVRFTDDAVPVKQIVKAIGGATASETTLRSWSRAIKARGREFLARVEETGDDIWFNVYLELKSIDSARPLRGSATFHLHETFPEPEPRVRVEDGVARCEFLSYGAFAAGVTADQGSTTLAIDLGKIPGVPAIFKEW